MPDRDALSETLQRLAQALGAGGAAPPERQRRHPSEGGLLRPVPAGWAPRAAGASLELPPGVQVAGNFLCADAAHRPLALHFEDGALHVVVSADRTESALEGHDAEEAVSARERSQSPGLRLRIEILLGPPTSEEVH